MTPNDTVSFGTLPRYPMANLVVANSQRQTMAASDDLYPPLIDRPNTGYPTPPTVMSTTPRGTLTKAGTSVPGTPFLQSTVAIPATTDAQWNKMVGGQSPGQSDQDIFNKPPTVYSAGFDPRPKPDNSTHVYFQPADGPGLNGNIGSQQVISSESMKNISPELSRALSGARAAAADRGDFEAIRNSYGGNFNGGANVAANYPAPNPVGDLISEARSQLRDVTHDTSYTGRILQNNLVNRIAELTKLDQAQQHLGIERGTLGVHQRDVAVREAGVPIAGGHLDVAKVNANSAYQESVERAKHAALLNTALTEPDEQKAMSMFSRLRKGASAAAAKPDLVPVQTQSSTQYLPVDSISAQGAAVAGVPGVPVAPVQTPQFGPPPKNPLGR